MKNVNIDHPVEKAVDNKPTNAFDAGVVLFTETKPEGDPDLVKEIRTMLNEAGVSEEALVENYDNNRHIKGAQEKISVVQRVQINRFTDVILKSSTENTTSMRSELPTGGALQHWVLQMKSAVIPFIATRRLLG